MCRGGRETAGAGCQVRRGECGMPMQMTAASCRVHRGPWKRLHGRGTESVLEALVRTDKIPIDDQFTFLGHRRFCLCAHSPYQLYPQSRYALRQ